MEILIRHSVSIFITIGILFPFILLNTIFNTVVYKSETLIIIIMCLYTTVLILNKGYT